MLWLLAVLAQGVLMADCSGIQVQAGGRALADAVASAPDGAVLCLAPGEHAAGFDLEKSLSFVGEDPARTVLKGDGRGPVLRVNRDDVTVKLSRLTVRGGVAAQGGALSLEAFAALIVEDAVLSGNRAGYYGGGAVFANAGRLELVRTVLEDNQGKQGGAVLLDKLARAELRGCTFRANQAEAGGALRVLDGAQVKVVEGVFEGNRSGDQATVLSLAGTSTRAPSLALDRCRVPQGTFDNRAPHPGALTITGSRLPAAWKGAAGWVDGGANTFGE
jgi:hypothetical protein